MLVSTESILIVNSNLPDKVTWNLVTNSIEKSAEQLFWQKKRLQLQHFFKFTKEISSNPSFLPTTQLVPKCVSSNSVF